LQKKRQLLHQWPELSGNEQATATRIKKWLQAFNPQQLLTGIGGHGVAAVFGQIGSGASVLLRCELDALPIQEINHFDYCSQHKGVAHKCGHDGHMAILLEVAQRLYQQPLSSGRVILLFQPAEETGTGALAVSDDMQFQQLQPNYAFALHNMPGYPLGSVIVRKGTMNCASRGLTIRLHGKTAHAAQPETGHSPALAMAALIDDLSAYTGQSDSESLMMATVVGARLGDKAFGTAPAAAELYVTLRSETQTGMQTMLDSIKCKLTALCQQYQLQSDQLFDDVFPATVNTAIGANVIRQAAINNGQPLIEPTDPIRWSEDFGHLIDGREGGLFGLGAGEQQPALHNPDYDFPDDLIAIGANLFMDIIEQCITGKTGPI